MGKMHKMDVKNLKTEAHNLSETYKDGINEAEFPEEVESLKHHALPVTALKK